MVTRSVQLQLVTIKTLIGQCRHNIHGFMVLAVAIFGCDVKSRKRCLYYYYCIRLIRRRGYYLFHCLSLCSVYSRAVTIQEWFLLILVAAREAIRREIVD